jgi:hypothetical protein
VERHVGLLGHGQRVHIGAHRDRGSRAAALEQRHDSGVRDTRLHLEPQLPQVIGDQFRGACLAIAEFGVLVDVAAPGDDLG